MTTTVAAPVPARQPPPTSPEGVLIFSCRDRQGIVAAVSSFITDHDGDIVESTQYGDREAGMLFMRVQFALDDPDELERWRREFAPVAGAFDMTWRMVPATARQRVLILVSKYAHCLNDLLFRTSTGWLNIDVVAVVSNHPDLGIMADSFGVPFHHVPVAKDAKAAAEQRLLDLVDELDVDLVVLARYMQILSPELCTALEGRAINIHHSMLPSFKGGSPYKQAHDRGVKLIGATAHYVTPDLDEGPIIEQEVARVDHAMTTEQVTALGRDTECLALARAVHWHTDSRVLLDGRRTVVFR